MARIPYDEDEEGQPAKRQKTAPSPEDLSKGSIVLFYGDKRGIVRDAYVPLDEFWVAEEKTGQLVKDVDGEVVPFKATDLRIVPGTQEALPTKVAGTAARVLIVGTEVQMVQCLDHFGAPDAEERRDPQQLLALPCQSCRCGPYCARFDPFRREMCNIEVCPICHVANEGLDANLVDLAKNLRPDIHVKVRAFHLKQAIEQVGPDLNKLDGYFCLAALTLPFGQQDIKASTGWEKRWRSEVRCQIDLGVSAEAAHAQGDNSPEDTAKRALKEYCNVTLSEKLWDESVQLGIRKEAGVDIPLKYWDGPDAKVFVIMLPASSTSTISDGTLHFFSGGASVAAARPAPSRGVGGNSSQQLIGGKTASEWRDDQSQFSHLPKLPKGWIRIKSKSSAEVYFYNIETSKSQFDIPCPEGWTKHVSKSTNKTYYFHARKKTSLFEYPTDAN